MIVRMDTRGIERVAASLGLLGKNVLRDGDKAVQIEAEKVMEVAKTSKDVWRYVSNPKDLKAFPPIPGRRTVRSEEAVKKISAPMRVEIGMWRLVHNIIYARPKPPRKPELEKAEKLREKIGKKNIENAVAKAVKKHWG